MPSFVTVLDNYKQYADLCLSPDSSTCVLLFTDKYVQSDCLLQGGLCADLWQLGLNVHRKSTPPLFSALSRDYKDHLSFAVVRTASADAQAIIAEFAPVTNEKVCERAWKPQPQPSPQLLGTHGGIMYTLAVSRGRGEGAGENDPLQWRVALLS
jgi:hypothetical protein